MKKENLGKKKFDEELLKGNILDQMKWKFFYGSGDIFKNFAVRFWAHLGEQKSFSVGKDALMSFSHVGITNCLNNEPNSNNRTILSNNIQIILFE